MAIAFESTAWNLVLPGSSVTVSCTVNSAHTTIVLFVGWQNSASFVSVTRNGNNFTLVDTEYVIVNGTSATNKIRRYVMPNADIGTYNITLTLNSSVVAFARFCTYTGTADTWTGNFSSFTENNGTTAARTLTISTNNSWAIIDGQPNGTATAGSGTTQRDNNIGWCGDSNAPLSTGTATLNINQTPSGWNCYATLEIQPFTVAAQTANPAFLLNFI